MRLDFLVRIIQSLALPVPKPALLIEEVLVPTLLVGSLLGAESIDDGARLPLGIVLPGFVWVFHIKLANQGYLREIS